MIEVRALGKRYYTEPGPRRKARGIDALRDVTVSIPAGSALGVVGPNGAGKSTLFSLLLGFIKPTSGSIEIDGWPRAISRRNAARPTCLSAFACRPAGACAPHWARWPNSKTARAGRAR
jgi:ABC-type multidrug transport system ATPase subunit